MKTENARHTPGPWTYKQDGNAYPSISVRARSVSGFASHTEVARTGTEANARLIAAAPAMLELIEELAAHECYNLPGEYPDEGEEGRAPCLRCRAKAFIAKIEGR